MYDGKSLADMAGQAGTKLAFELESAVALPSLKRKDTSRCFGAAPWEYKDRDIDRLLPKTQGFCEATRVSVFRSLRNRLTFRHMVAAILAIPPETPVRELELLFGFGRHALKLTQIEDLIRRFESGEAVGLQADSRGNFVFLEDRWGRLQALCLMRNCGQWYAHLHPFSNVNQEMDYGWGKPDRLIVARCTQTQLLA